MDRSTEELLQQDWSGRCYEAAWNWIMSSKERVWLVVHGKVWTDRFDKPMGHAWCEHADIVVDLTRPVGERIIGRERYYMAVNVVDKTYSSIDAKLLSGKNGHFGPWEEWEQLEDRVTVGVTPRP